MSNVDKHEKLITVLLNENDFMTSEVLANKLDTSTKTIYRWIKAINADRNGKPLIISESRKGYKLDYNQYLMAGKHKGNEAFSSEHRRWKITQRLLLQAPQPISLFDLMSEFFISESILNSDEKAIQKSLENYRLTLVRKNRELFIQGEEAQIRSAIAAGMQYYHIVDLVELESNAELDLNKKDAAFIMLQLEAIEKKYGITIPYPYNINIFLHLYIMMERSKNAKMTAESALLKDLDDKELKWHAIARRMIENIQDYLGKPIDDSEVTRLFHYLAASRMQLDCKESDVQFSDLAVAVTKSYLALMSSCLAIEIADEAIFRDLASHIDPMLKRLEQNITVSNGLLSQIKMIYRPIFESVSQVSALISEKYHLKKISEDEDGFITLYFAKLLEAKPARLKTIVVCSTGIGISELLKVKISNAFSEIDIVSVLSARELKTADISHIDLVISTIALDFAVETDFLLISGMFSKDDKRLLRKKIEEIHHG